MAVFYSNLVSMMNRTGQDTESLEYIANFNRQIQYCHSYMLKVVMPECDKYNEGLAVPSPAVTSRLLDLMDIFDLSFPVDDNNVLTLNLEEVVTIWRNTKVQEDRTRTQWIGRLYLCAWYLHSRGEPTSPDDFCELRLLRRAMIFALLDTEYKPMENPPPTPLALLTPDQAADLPKITTARYLVMSTMLADVYESLNGGLTYDSDLDADMPIEIIDLDQEVPECSAIPDSPASPEPEEEPEMQTQCHSECTAVTQKLKPRVCWTYNKKIRQCMRPRVVNSGRVCRRRFQNSSTCRAY
jgi:hypothetical protein